MVNNNKVTSGMYPINSNNTILNWFFRHRFIIILFAVHSVIWLAIDQFITPHPDYIDHWMQSRIFSLSYFEHPPMVALLIRLTSSIFGISETGFELAALFINFFILGFAYAISRYVYGHMAGIFTLIGLELTPFFMIKSASIQTEQPLAIFWLATLLCILVYQKSGKARWLLITGLFAGCGGLSKYTMVLFYVGLFVYYTLVSSRRKEWLNPWQYLGGIIALVVVSPVVIWNYQNEWVSFLFQLSKGSGASDGHFGEMTGVFLLGTLFVYSAVLIIWGVWRMIRRFRQKTYTIDRKLADSPGLLMIVLTATFLLFFSIVLLSGDYADPQWAVLPMVTFFIWLGHESADLWKAGKRKGIITVYTSAFVLNLGLMGLLGALVNKPLFYENYTSSPAYPIVAWDQTGEEMVRFLDENNIPLPEYVVSNHYPLASQFALFLPSHPKSYAAGRILRNLWSDPNNMTAENTLFVCEAEDTISYECSTLRERSEKILGFKIEKVGQISHSLWDGERKIDVYRIQYKSAALLSPSEKDPRL